MPAIHTASTPPTTQPSIKVTWPTQQLAAAHEKSPLSRPIYTRSPSTRQRTPNSSPVVVDLTSYKAVKMENERGEIVDLYVFPRWSRGVKVWSGGVWNLENSHFCARQAIGRKPWEKENPTFHYPGCSFSWPARKKKSKKKNPRRRKGKERETNVPRIATSPASAAPPTASSRPTTTAPSRSPSARSTRTAATPARTRPTLCAVSSVPAARAMTPWTVSPSATDTWRMCGLLSGKFCCLLGLGIKGWWFGVGLRVGWWVSFSSGVVIRWFTDWRWIGYAIPLRLIEWYVPTSTVTNNHDDDDADRSVQIHTKTRQNKLQ